jgi:parvulin-like peptidyl-prolyl isomerase
MKRILKEPLLHFLVLGALLFAGYGALNRSAAPAPGRIVISQGQQASMLENFIRTKQRAPTREEFNGLIQDRLREEVYCREAMALGLDNDDTVIRRRLRQKMEFISDDISAQAQPTDADLNSYLAAHPDLFRMEQQYTFYQVYLDPEKHGDNLARDAAQLLAKLNQAGGENDFAGLGDVFMLGNTFRAASASEVARQFGREFAVNLGGLQPGPWQGPVESGFGVHLVCIRDRTEGRLPALVEVRDAVRREWDDAHRRKANEAFYQELLKHYTVIIEEPVAAGTPVNVSQVQ